ncbi:MAG: T9SS type A sorting domain-containing protein, partial [Bacteroidota bacterium]
AVKHDTVTNGCYIHVYDATNPSNVHFIEYIPAGLWHFDLDVVPPRVYVASEWYGIKTVDITDLHNPVDEGNTVTGGWNIDADKQGDLLAVANEGYGFKLYDVSDVTQPLLRDTDQTPGFCHKIRMSEDAQYIYTCNSSYQGFRVFRSDSLIQTGFVQDAVANHRAEVYNNHVIGSLVFLTISQLTFVDVSDPYAPYIDTIINTPVNDFSVSANGVLFLSANDVLKAWDISGSMVVLLDTVPLGAAEDGMAVAVFDDIFYVFIEGKGLTRYELVLNGSFYELQELSTWNIAYGKPDYMAADAFGLYLGYRLRGLYAFDKNTGTEIDWYRDGLDYRKYTGQYGIQALSCRDSLIVLTEYFSQTSLLTFCNNYPLQDYELRPTGCGLAIYPNPSDGEMTVRFDPKGKPGNYKWGLFSVAGVETAHGSVASGGNETQFRISLGNLSPGVYFFSMYGMQYPGCRKIIIE